MPNIDVDRVNKILSRNETAQSLRALLSSRDREPRSGEIPLPHLANVLKMRKFKFNKQEILSTFVEMEKAGVGKLKGDVFIVAKGLSIKELCGASASATHQPTSLKVPDAVQGTKSIIMPLSNRADRVFEATYPVDITKQEIEGAFGFLLRSRGF